MGQIWFGNLERAGYVPAPEAGMDANNVGVEETLSYDNGGLFIGANSGTHREYNMAWGLSDRKYMDWLTDYRQGVYGNGFLYFVDPFATNWLPPHWATPALTAGDWPSLIAAGVQPTVANTPTSNYNMPKRGAQYNVTASEGELTHRQLVLLIPNDQTLSIGFSGSATNGGIVRVIPVLRNGMDAAPQDLTLLSPSGSTRMNKSFNGLTYSAIRVYITATQAGASTVTLYSGTAVYRTLSGGLMTGDHTTGQGHTGLRYMSSPTISYVQAARGKQLIKAAADFGEVGAWA